MQVLTQFPAGFHLSTGAYFELAPFATTVCVRPLRKAAIHLLMSVKCIDVIENVQKRATKLVNGFSNLEYSQRARGDMIELFKQLRSNDKNTLPICRSYATVYRESTMCTMCERK